MRFLIIVSLLVLGINNLLPFVFKIQSNNGITVACLSIIFTILILRWLENLDENNRYKCLPIEHDISKKTSVYDEFLKDIRKWNDYIKFHHMASASFYVVRIAEGTWAIDCIDADDRKYHKTIKLEERGRKSDLTYLLHYFRTEHDCMTELPDSVKTAMTKLIEDKVNVPLFSLIDSCPNPIKYHIRIAFI